MQCLKCDCQSFTAKNIVIDTVGFCPAWICDNCEEPIMDDDQMNQSLEKKRERKTYDERRREAIAAANEKWLNKDKMQENKPQHPWKKIFSFRARPKS